MVVQRVKVPLLGHEYEALARLSDAEVRPVDDQVRFLILAELRRRGLISDRTEGSDHD